MLIKLAIVLGVMIYLIISVIIISKIILNPNPELSDLGLGKAKIKCLPIEAEIMEKLHLLSNKQKKMYLFWERFIIIAFILSSYFFMGFIMLFFVSVIVSIIITRGLNETLIRRTGIKYVEETNRFLDMYVPALMSGISNDQAILKYISSSGDPELFQWWANKDQEISLKYKNIVRIYHMVKFNEERGNGDSVDIIKEMQLDLAQKQKYYNDYLARANAIMPIAISYYIFVPIFLAISFSRVPEFWYGPWGLVSIIILSIMFFLYQFMIYKVKQGTIKKIF